MAKMTDKQKKRLKTLGVGSLIVGILLLLCLPNYFSLRKLSKENQTLTLNNQELSEQLSNCIRKGACFVRYCVKPIEINPTLAGGYTVCIDGVPTLLKGVGYRPTPIGKGYDYDFFADETKPWLVDGKLMQEAGINCVRIYSAGADLEQVKEFIRDMYEKFGIYTIMSDWLGLWEYPRANYADKEFQQKTKERILKMVAALKSEKGLLMWILGNENNYSFTDRLIFWTSPEIEALPTLYQKQIKRAQIYYSFINDLTQEIKRIDKVHPVALGNGEANYLEIASKFCPDIDVLAIIIYRGKTFGNLFQNVRNVFDKPILLSEFGCDSYDAYKSEEDQDVQSLFLLSQWDEIYKNSVFSGNESGNVIGGCLFEWNDEWWKHNEGYQNDWSIHNTEAGWSQGSYFFDVKAEDGMNMNEEWFGIISLSEEIENGINKRIPKKSYHDLKSFFADLDVDLSQ